jgi:hypothetical protein
LAGPQLVIIGAYPGRQAELIALLSRQSGDGDVPRLTAWHKEWCCQTGFDLSIIKDVVQLW